MSKTVGLKNLLTYYGGKYLLRDIICALFHLHITYVEPFVGGGAVFWHKQRSVNDVINDLDRRVITFYEVCKDRGMFAELQGLIAKTLHSRALFNDCKLIMKAVQESPDNPPSKAEQAWAFWYLCNGSFMGSYGGQWAYVIGKAGSNSAESLCEKRRLFETDAICERLATTNIECQPANQVIGRYDAIDTLFYCDPPYFNSDMCAYMKQKNGKAYSEHDFNELLALLSGIKGKFILSCYPSALVEQYAKDFGWSKQSFEMKLCASKVTGECSRPKGGKTECIFMNYDLTQTVRPTLFP